MSTYYLDTSAGETGLVFLSADDRLNGAAVLEGLGTDNPNNYPA